MTEDRVAEFCARIEAGIHAPQLAPFKHRPYDAPAPWVADAILRALDHQPPLIELRVTPGGGGNWALAYEGPLLRRRDGRLTRATAYWTAPGRRTERMFAAEGVVGLAAASRLVLDFGHPVDAVELESHRGEVDGVAYEHAGQDARPVLAIEAKQDDVELRALVIGIEACRGSGGERAHRQATIDAGIRGRAGWAANHHKKCAFLGSGPPIAFWPVSPGTPDGMAGEIRIARPSGDGFLLEAVPVGTLDRAHLIAALHRTA